MVEKYRQTLKELKDTDILLEMLQSFKSSPSFYSIPDCVKKEGVSVFYCSPHQVIPEPGG